MGQDHAQEKAALIERIAEFARQRLGGAQAAQAERFVRYYYEASNADDLLALPPDDLYGAALSHWKLAQLRRPGEVLLHVYNPRYDEHGWQSTHTVIEVVMDDMPFLVDSISMELLREGYGLHLMKHPVMRMVRGGRGELEQVLPRSAEIIAALEAQSLPIPSEDQQEAVRFLRWVGDDHFTFIGFRAYDLVAEGGQDTLRQVPGSGLGILRDGDTASASQSFAHIPPPLKAQAREPTLLIITKSTAVSRVHRPVHLDYLGIKRYSDAGEVIGEWRFLGLYSSLAYSARPSEIPMQRKKVDYVVDKAGYPPASHDRKALVHILDTIPRDEMFQFAEEELFEVTTGILQVQERHRLGLFLRKDLFGRFITALVYVPRDRYHTELRRRIQEILMRALDGESVEFNIQISESPLARVHFIIRTRAQQIPEYDTAQLQARMVEAMSSWQDDLLAALHNQLGEEQGAKLYHRYHDAFPPAYRDDYSPRTAVVDIQRLEGLDETAPLTTHLYRPVEEDGALLRFKIYGGAEQMALSDVLPMLEHMGVRVLSARPYEITPRSSSPNWILDFDMTAGTDHPVDVMEVKELFQETFIHLCRGTIENDGFNRLVLAAELHWRSVVMLRALCKYLLQTPMRFSQSYIELSLANNPAAVKRLVELFEVRFAPRAQNSAERVAELAAAIEKILATVTNLDEDRILRQFLALMQAMLRTNYYQHDVHRQPKPYLSFKFDSAKIPNLPLPRPMYEKFVYSPRIKGVHLRNDPVERN